VQIFVSPLFHIAPILSFADDNHKTNQDKEELTKDIDKSLEAIAK
jgi:hypothetical protein